MKCSPSFFIDLRDCNGWLCPRGNGAEPVMACKNLLKKTGRKIDDYDLIEMHEAFAAQYLACEKDLDLQCWHLG